MMWEKNYRLLIKFQQKEGHSNVQFSYIEDDIKLGNWLLFQRKLKKKGKLDRSNEKRLDDVGVVWDVLSEQWEKNYRLLIKFQQREGHSNVPGSYIEDDTKLGIWLVTQRQLKKKGKLDQSNEKRLDDVGVVWDVLSEQWEKNYRLLIKFQQREGHSNVPQRYIEDHIKLGNWLSAQRQQKKKGKLDQSKEKRLDEIGVVW